MKKKLKLDSPNRLKDQPYRDPPINNCSMCAAAVAFWCSGGIFYCSVCMPEEIIEDYCEPRTPEERVNFRRTLRRSGNIFLNGGPEKWTP